MIERCAGHRNASRRSADNCLACGRTAFRQARVGIVGAVCSFGLTWLGATWPDSPISLFLFFGPWGTIAGCLLAWRGGLAARRNQAYVRAPGTASEWFRSALEALRSARPAPAAGTGPTGRPEEALPEPGAVARPRRRPSRFLVWCLGSADDADELASLAHDAAAATTRPPRLRRLDRLSTPVMWVVALARAGAARTGALIGRRAR